MENSSRRNHQSHAQRNRHRIDPAPQPDLTPQQPRSPFDFLSQHLHHLHHLHHPAFVGFQPHYHRHHRNHHPHHPHHPHHQTMLARLLSRSPQSERIHEAEQAERELDRLIQSLATANPLGAIQDSLNEHFGAQKEAASAISFLFKDRFDSSLEDIFGTIQLGLDQYKTLVNQPAHVLQSEDNDVFHDLVDDPSNPTNSTTTSSIGLVLQQHRESLLEKSQLHLLERKQLEIDYQAELSKCTTAEDFIAQSALHKQATLALFEIQHDEISQLNESFRVKMGGTPLPPVPPTRELTNTPPPPPPPLPLPPSADLEFHDFEPPQIDEIHNTASQNHTSQSPDHTTPPDYADIGDEAEIAIEVEPLQISSATLTTETPSFHHITDSPAISSTSFNSADMFKKKDMKQKTVFIQEMKSKIGALDDVINSLITLVDFDDMVDIQHDIRNEEKSEQNEIVLATPVAPPQEEEEKDSSDVQIMQDFFLSKASDIQLADSQNQSEETEQEQDKTTASVEDSPVEDEIAVVDDEIVQQFDEPVQEQEHESYFLTESVVMIDHIDYEEPTVEGTEQHEPETILEPIRLEPTVEEIKEEEEESAVDEETQAILAEAAEILAELQSEERQSKIKQELADVKNVHSMLDVVSFDIEKLLADLDKDRESSPIPQDDKESAPVEEINQVEEVQEPIQVVEDHTEEISFETKAEQLADELAQSIAKDFQSLNELDVGDQLTTEIDENEQELPDFPPLDNLGGHQSALLQSMTDSDDLHSSLVHVTMSQFQSDFETQTNPDLEQSQEEPAHEEQTQQQEQERTVSEEDASIVETDVREEEEPQVLDTIDELTAAVCPTNPVEEGEQNRPEDVETKMADIQTDVVSDYFADQDSTPTELQQSIQELEAQPQAEIELPQQQQQQQQQRIRYPDDEDDWEFADDYNEEEVAVEANQED